MTTTASTTPLLLRMLVEEISIDGGACLVTSLKDYLVARQDTLVQQPQQPQPSKSNSSSSICRKSKQKRRRDLNSLLLHSNIGKPRLLAFLESHPTVFSVDRTVIPHWVKLVSPSPSLSPSPSPSPSPMNRNEEGKIAQLQQRVYHKALYVLRKRQACIDRRYQRSIHKRILPTAEDERDFSARVDVEGNNLKKNNTTISGDDADVDADADDVNETNNGSRRNNNNNNNNNNHHHNNSVNTHWLLRHCAWDFHFYLRVCHFYQNPMTSGYETPEDVQRVGSREWEAVTLPTFEQILVGGTQADHSAVSASTSASSSSLSSLSLIHVQHGKAVLKKCASDDHTGNYSMQPEEEGNTKKKINTESIIVSQSSSFLVDESKSEFEKQKHCPDTTRKQDHRTTTTDDTVTRTSSVDVNFQILLHRLDQTLTDIICEQDGGHQIRLQLLLHRYPHIKELLGGRDLWKLYTQYQHIPRNHHPHDINNNNNTDHDHCDDERTTSGRSSCYFESIIIFPLGPDLILRSKRPKTNPKNIMVSNNCNGGDNNDDDNGGNGDNSKGYCDDEKRMKVDEVGLYSVTNTKWGRAIANLLIQACHQKHLFSNDRSSFSLCSDKSSHDSLTKMSSSPGNRNDNSENENAGSPSPSPSSSSTDQFLLQQNNHNRMVIDLTASVGGMTLALAKSNFFDRVVAVEIDKERAALCQENMKRHGFDNNNNKQNTDTDTAQHRSTIVEVRHEDSVQQIPFLPRGVCFVIDPPWGGYNYKQQVRRRQQQQVKGGSTNILRLGAAPLEDVLALLSHHNAPCVVGVRLPVNFIVQHLLTALAEKIGEEGIHFECLTRRKISVQLFVILYFPASASSSVTSPTIPTVQAQQQQQL